LYFGRKEAYGTCVLSEFENRVLRRMFGPEREEVSVSWVGLHNEELHNLYAYQILLG
jgi:hypothetical protein